MEYTPFYTSFLDSCLLHLEFVNVRSNGLNRSFYYCSECNSSTVAIKHLDMRDNYIECVDSSQVVLTGYDCQCCDMGQNDTIGRIELNPSFVLSSDNTNCRMTFNSSSSCLMSYVSTGITINTFRCYDAANSGMTILSLVLTSDSFSCNCNSINPHLSIDS